MANKQISDLLAASRNAVDTDQFAIDDASNISKVMTALEIKNYINSGLLSATLSDTQIFVGNGSNIAIGVAMSSGATISNTGVVTLGNTAVTGQLITGFVAGAGTVADTDTILEALQKLDGNITAESIWNDDGTDITPQNAGRNLDITTGILKDNDVTAGIALGDSSNTVLDSDFIAISILGAMNANKNTFVAQTNSGIADPSQLAITYNATNRQFTVVNNGTTIDVNGQTSTPANETTSAHVDTTAQYWAYYTAGSTTLTVSTTIDWAIHALVDRVYYNTDQSSAKAIEFNEKHSQAFTAKIHENQHETIGAKLVTNPLGATASDFVLKSDVDGDMQFSLTAAEIYDEDIEHVITALAAGGYSIAYRAGTDASQRLDWLDSESLPFLSGGTFIQYNQISAGNWSLTELGNGEYVNYYVFGWTRTDNTRDIIIFMGQEVFGTLADAQQESVGDLQLPTLLAPEQVPLYQFTFRTSNGFSSTGKTRIEAVVDYRGTVTGAQVVSGSVVDHQSTTNRNVDGHTQYALLAGRIGGQILNGSDTTAETMTIYNNAIDGLGFLINADGSLTVNATNYETLVTADDHIPNKKYVDDSVSKVGINNQTGTTYIITASDMNKKIKLTNAGAITLTLPEVSTEDLEVGFQCFIQQGGAGQVTIVKEGSDVLNSADSLVKLRTTDSGVWIVKEADALYYLSGDLTA